MERSMRPRSRTDNKGMSQKVTEPTTKSPDGLTIAERNKRDKAAYRARMKNANEAAIMAEDPRLPGAAEKKAAERKESEKIFKLMFGEDMPEKKMSGGKMKKPVAMSYGGKMPKKMGSGGSTCRGMGAATRGGNFKMG